MTVVTRLEAIPFLAPVTGLTLGMFDGVHRGHQVLLRRLKEKLGGGLLCVLTFSNHPTTLFTPQTPVLPIYPTTRKHQLLFDYGASLVIDIPFTKDVANTPFDVFLKFLHDRLRFSYFVVGEGTTLGKGREGDESKVKGLGKELGFKAEYLPKLSYNHAPISSRRIRSCIQAGHFEEVAMCLGRPYALFGTWVPDESVFVLEEEGLCLPPPGTYDVVLEVEGRMCRGVANLQPGVIRLSLEARVSQGGAATLVFH